MQPSSNPGAGLETQTLRIFILSASIAASLCVAGGFLGMALKDRQLIRDEMLNRSRQDFANIVLMRRWNASYGGVYVEKGPGVISNPYLENPDITDLAGKIYTKKNPALMTRELSEMLQKELGYSFQITSLRPLNPNNAPDPREAEALRSFERGQREHYWIEQKDGQTLFRYMGPLRTDTTCLPCHARQGYKTGDIRGGISVSFRVDELQRKLKNNLYMVIGLGALTTVMLVGSLLLLFHQMVLKLREARDKLVMMATIDALTGLLNRASIIQRLREEMERHRRSGQPLGCIMVDVDLFKQVNDRLGHAAGDEVLRQVAGEMKAALRPYDALGRIGGEEFMIILPTTHGDELRVIAERLRARIQEKVRSGTAEAPLSVTASFGITLRKDEDSPEKFMGRADLALYKAKASGRNRVEALEA